jgi:hypothetical protein
MQQTRISQALHVCGKRVRRTRQRSSLTLLKSRAIYWAQPELFNRALLDFIGSQSK